MRVYLWKSFTPIKGEIWLPIEGCLGFEVSSFGRVKTEEKIFVNKNGVKRVFKSRMLRSSLVSGYPAVHLPLEGGRIRIHILVCAAFHGSPPSPDHEVAHWDGDRTNNLYTNLRWATHKENAEDTVRHGRMPHSENCPAAKFTNNEVREIRTLVASGISRREMARRLGVQKGTINDMVRRKTWANVL